MSNKKNRGPKAGAFEKVAALITKFEQTSKGDPDRGHFGHIVQEAVSGRIVARNDVPLTPEQRSLALQGLPTGASSHGRRSTISFIKGKLPPELFAPVEQ